jgi:hypothetical protein
MKEFTKANLKNRMVVEYRNGERRMVVDNMLIGYSQRGDLNNYNDDLSHKGTFSKGLDIVRIYPEINVFRKKYDKTELAMPIWERPEVKKITMSEVEEKFGCKVKIVKE